MKDKTLVSVSFCVDHFKGGDGINRMPSQEHWEWLEEAVDHYTEQGWQTIVAATGFSGMTNIEQTPDDKSRDVAWRIFKKVRAIVGVPQNPGHQVGAALCIRLGLETAAKLDCDYLVHTAEDVMPFSGALEIMTAALEEGFDYAGERWGFDKHERGCAQLNSQFFACRVQSLVGPWDACQVSGHGCIERYLFHLLAPLRLATYRETVYRTTHDHSEWNRWRKDILQ